MTTSNDATSLAALKRAKRLIDEVVYEKFDWARSALDANAIQLLNEVPMEVERQIELLEKGVDS
jgi:hypothetical protein